MKHKTVRNIGGFIWDSSRGRVGLTSEGGWVVQRRSQMKTRDGGAYFEFVGGGANKQASEALTCSGSGDFCKTIII